MVNRASNGDEEEEISASVNGEAFDDEEKRQNAV